MAVEQLHAAPAIFVGLPVEVVDAYVAVNTMKNYTHPNPKAVAEVTSCRQQQYRNTLKLKAKGKTGVMQKGLLRSIKDATKKGNDTTELRRQALAVAVYSCRVCGSSYRYASQLAQHV